jgi:hypothetical protein
MQRMADGRFERISAAAATAGASSCRLIESSVCICLQISPLPPIMASCVRRLANRFCAKKEKHESLDAPAITVAIEKKPASGGSAAAPSAQRAASVVATAEPHAHEEWEDDGADWDDDRQSSSFQVTIAETHARPAASASSLSATQSRVALPSPLSSVSSSSSSSSSSSTLPAAPIASAAAVYGGMSLVSSNARRPLPPPGARTTAAAAPAAASAEEPVPDVDYFQQMALNPTQMKSNKVLVRPAPSAFTASAVSASSKLSMSMDELDVGAASWGDVDVTIESGRKKAVGETRAAPKGMALRLSVSCLQIRRVQGYQLDDYILVSSRNHCWICLRSGQKADTGRQRRRARH